MARAMGTLTITWQRLVEAGATCPRCGDTGAEVRRAAETLRRALAPLGIEVVLQEVELGLDAFQREPLASNRVVVDGRTLEAWLGGTTGQSPCCEVCGPAGCRTVRVEGQTYEAVPAELVIRAGLIAAAGLLAGTAAAPCCTGDESPGGDGCCH